MPDIEDDPLLPRGYRTLEGGGLPRNPTLPVIANQFGDVVGIRSAAHRYSPATALGPSVDDIQEAVYKKEDENKRGAFWDLLALPEKIIGQTIKGAIRGGAEGGVSGALKGAWEGSAFAFASDWLFGTAIAKETSASDIRRAFDDTSEQTGVGNFFLNLAIDVALDPLSLLLTPLGKTAQALAKAAKGAEELAMFSKAAAAAQLMGKAPVKVLSMLDDFKVSASLEKAFDVADRAWFVLRLPGAKNPFFEFNPLAFKSFSTAFGRSLDRTMGAVRAGPIGDVIRKVKLDYVKIADPEKAAAAADLLKAEERGRRQSMAVLSSILNNQVGEDSLKFIAKSKPEFLEAYTTLREGGVLTLDQEALITELARAPDVVLRREKLNRLLHTDPKFAKLYETATSQTPEAIGFGMTESGAKYASTLDPKAREALDALNEIYRTRPDVPLPEPLLAAAKLPKRYGVEMSAMDAPLTPETIAAAHPGSLSRGESVRAAEAAATQNTTGDVLQGVRTRLRSTFDDILALPPEDKEKINRWLTGSAYAMKELARMEALGHVMNASFEFYAGPYVYRMLNPAAKTLLNDHVRAKIGGLGQFGVNVNERFLKNREFTDLLTIEASALAEELGIKSTGYAPLKDLVKAHNDHGADGVFGWILDKPFIRKLWEQDPEAAAFFSTNPLHNDYSRALAGGRAMGKQAYFDAFFDSILVKSTSKSGELHKIQEHTSKGLVGLIRDKDAGGVTRTSQPSAATLVREGLAPEIRSRFDVAHAQVQDDLARRLAHESADFMHEKDALQRALDIHPKMSDEALKALPDDSTNVGRMKSAAIDVRQSEAAMRDADALRAGFKQHVSYEGGGATTPEHIKAKINQHAADFNARGEYLHRDFVVQLKTEQDALREARDALDRGSSEASEWMRAGTKGEQQRLKSAAGDLRDVDAAESLKPSSLPRGEDVGYPLTPYEESLRVKARKGEINEAVARRRKEAVYVGRQGSADRKAWMADAQRRVDGYQTRIDELQAMVDQTKNRQSWVSAKIQFDHEQAALNLKQARELHDGTREAVRASLTDLSASEREVVAMMKGGARDQRELLQAIRGRGVTAATMNREIVLWHTLKAKGALAVDEAKAWVGQDGKSLFDRMPKETEIHWVEKGDWDAVQNTFAELNKPDMFRQNPIARALDVVKSYWAPYTAVNPLFLNSRVRDQVTNVITLMNGGFKHWSSFSEAGKTRWALNRSLVGKQDAETLDGVFATRRLADGTAETMTRRQALDAMQANGTVTGTSMWAGELMQSTEDYARMYGANSDGVVRSALSAVLPVSAGVNSPVIRTGMQLAGYLDDTARIAGWRDAWMRGMSTDQAADHVASTLYNSMRQSTSTERYLLRRVIPFYSFSRWALGQSVDIYFKKPGVLSTLSKIRDTSYNSPIAGGPPMDPAQVDTILPQFLKDGIGIPYKNTPEGPRFFMFGSYLPVGELSQLVSGIVGMFDPKSTNGMLNYIGSKLNPAIKAPLTMLTNKNFFSDRDVEKFPGEHREFLGMSLTGTQYEIAHNMRFLGEIDRLRLFNREQAKLIVKASTEGGGDATKPLGQREELPFFERLAGSAFGFVPKNYLVDVSNDAMFARQRAAAKVNETKGLLRRRLIEREGKPSAEADVDSLKIVLADQLADQAMLSNLTQTYGVDAKRQMQARKRQDRLALSLLRDRPESE